MNSRTVMTALLAVAYMILLAPILLVGVLIQFREPILFFSRAFFGRLWPLLGFRIRVEGREHFAPGGRYVIMANHQSFIDGPLLFWAIPSEVRVILKKSIFRLPVIGLCMRFVGFVPVDRRRLRGGVRSVDRAAELMARRRYSFLIFPEGTRTRDGRFQPFKRGGFFLALKSGVPIVPASIRGTYRLMPRGSFRIGSGPINVRFFPPVPVRGLAEDAIPALVERVRKTIASGLELEGSPT